VIPPTRTELRRLRERRASIGETIAILDARRQALVREFLAAIRPFLRSRDAIRRDYGQARTELQLAKGHEGALLVDSLASGTERDIGVDVVVKNSMGVRYRELTVWGPLVRSPEERQFGYVATSPHLDEAAFLFERTAEAMLAAAVFESKLKRLGDEIHRVTRRTRALQERVLPALAADIRTVAQHLTEREREAHFRLKRFKTRRMQRAFRARPV
jgi:V/A-type H+/Na+-transporting ATPase subunit D